MRGLIEAIKTPKRWISEPYDFGKDSTRRTILTAARRVHQTYNGELLDGGWMLLADEIHGRPYAQDDNSHYVLVYDKQRDLFLAAIGLRSFRKDDSGKYVREASVVWVLFSQSGTSVKRIDGGVLVDIGSAFENGVNRELLAAARVSDEFVFSPRNR